MYQIATKKGPLGYAEAPDYCYKLPSGSAQVIGRGEKRRGETATGVIYGGTIYNLPECFDFEGAETAFVSEVNAAEILNGQAARLAGYEAAEADLDALTVDHELRLSLLELGVEGGES